MGYGADKLLVDDLGRGITADAGVRPGDDAELDAIIAIAKALPYAVSADGQVIAGPCVVYGYMPISGTSPTLALYDGTSNSGTPLNVGVTETAGTKKDLCSGVGVYCASGLYADVGGTNPVFTVFALPAA